MTRSPALAGLFAGLLSASGFAPLSLWPVTIAALAVLLHLIGRAATLRGALAIGWAFGFGQFALGLNWIATAFTYQAAMPAWLGWVAVLLLSAYLAVYPALACGLAWRFGVKCYRCYTSEPSSSRPEPAESGDGIIAGLVSFVKPALLLAAAWSVAEWLRAGMFTGFAWNPVGVIWIDTAVAQAAPYVGTYGLSALTVLAGGAALALARREPRAAALLAALPLVACGAALVGPEPGITDRMIRVVQPNIAQETRNSPDYAMEGLTKLAGLSQQPARAAPPRLLLWPEAAVEYYLEEDGAAVQAVAALLRPQDVLLTGGSALERDGAGALIAARNSLFAMDGRGALFARYDKAHLVPYGEYLPMRPVLSAIGLSRLVPGDLDFWAGPGPRTYALPGFGKVGVQICYEIIFSGEVVQQDDRPDFIFNPSNDAWFGAWGPPQHLAQARLRAVEEGLPVVRATPNGISAVVDARGRMVAEVPRHRAGVIDMTLPAPLPRTPFARAGNALPFALAASLALAAIAAGRGRRYAT